MAEPIWRKSEMRMKEEKRRDLEGEEWALTQIIESATREGRGGKIGGATEGTKEGDMKSTPKY